ncbi:MAG TPA: hypothetical protein VGA70_12635 [Longimicrobiales bacterium]
MAACPAAVACAPDTARPHGLEWLEAREAALRHRLDLADSGRLHLVLDGERHLLSLWHGGAELRLWSVSEITAGRRRPGGDDDPTTPDWRRRLWEDARLAPPVRRERRVIVSDSVAPPDLSGAVSWIPPGPDEAVPTPRRFDIRFQGGLAVEVVARDPDGSRPPAGWRDRLAGLLPRARDPYRIRLVMTVAEAGTLYRSLPEGSAFVAVLPSTSQHP